MNSVATDIQTILAQESSFVSGTNLFVSYEPAEPDNCITVYDTGGTMPDLTLQTQNYNRDSVQVRVRNNSYQEAMNLAWSIFDILQGKTDIVNNTRYTLIRVIIPPFHIGYDDNNRAIVTINFETQRTDV